MKFTWLAKDGRIYSRTIKDLDERLEFIEWLEYSPDVVKWW